MTVSTGATMKKVFNAVVALGDKAVSSDAYFEIQGFEAYSLLIKAFPWPQLTIGGEIEVPAPNGQAVFQPQQLKTHQQGQVTLMETVDGKINDLIVSLLQQSGKGGRFNATVYEGTPDKYTRKCPIYGCFFVTDTADRDWENRGQQLNISGTLFFHYYGDDQ